MGSLSIWHLLIIAFIILMIWGPNRLGDIGGSMGKAIRNFKKGLDGIDDIDVTQSTRKESLPAAPSSQNPALSQQPQPTATASTDPTSVSATAPKDPTKT